MSVEISLRDGVAVVRLSRPEVLNALDPMTVDRLISALRETGGDPRLRGIVLAGAGGNFCSGADVRVLAKMDAAPFRAFVESLQDLTRALRSLPFPSVAAVDGVAVGGGMEMALACDFRVASRSARLGFPEVRRGLVVTGGASRLLVLLVGLPVARRLLLGGELVDAEFARATGLVDEFCETGAAEDQAVALLERLRVGSAAALRETRRLLDLALEGSLDQVLDLEVDAILRCFEGVDAAEGLRAFLDRRPPRFSD